MTAQTIEERRLQAVFDTYADRVLAYVRRHVEAAGADDVVSEVFLTAWRRIGDLPAEPLPWLLVVARNTIRNRERTVSRHRRLVTHLSALDSAAATSPGAEDTVVERQLMVAALGELSDQEREALLLTAWDGLSAAHAALVAGCSRHAFEVRLHRARARLIRSLAHNDDPDRAGTATSLIPARLTTAEVIS